MIINRWLRDVCGTKLKRALARLVKNSIKRFQHKSCDGSVASHSNSTLKT